MIQVLNIYRDKMVTGSNNSTHHSLKSLAVDTVDCMYTKGPVVDTIFSIYKWQ